MSEVRLNKALADAGVCSRRKADELIFSGVVTVDGVVVDEPGRRVDPQTESIAVHGKPLAASESTDAGYTYIMLHKPVQVVSTASDPEGRRTVLDLLPDDMRKYRVYPVGRLDYFSEGLLLLTNDGELTNRLTHPRYHLPKRYEVRLRENPDDSALAAMRRGMRLREGEKLAPVGVRRIPGAPPYTLELVLHQGINRQIRRMCRDLGLTILTLRRVAVGELHLGTLPKGQARALTDAETAALHEAVGLGK